jgi:hypothetical protein
MGLFKFLFGNNLHIIEHEFFGTMYFISDKRDPAQDYFECRRIFKPTGKMIEISIIAGIAGPTPDQIIFFSTIEDRYEEIAKSTIPIIESEFHNWKEDFFISDISRQCKPVYLEIPYCLQSPLLWKISFESELDPNHTFIVTMQNFQAKEVLIDG